MLQTNTLTTVVAVISQQLAIAPYAVHINVSTSVSS